jgi:hypothetical protein
MLASTWELMHAILLHKGGNSVKMLAVAREITLCLTQKYSD